MTIEDIKQKAILDRVPIVKDDTLNVMLEIIKNNNYKDILELGTAVGYSSSSMALLDKSIHIDTLEKNEDSYNIAISNIKSLGLNNQINVINMPIEDFKTDKEYDFIFVDAAKAQYEKYFNQFINNLKPNGRMFFDNMAFHGLTKDVENIKNRNTRALVRKINHFRDNMLNRDGFDIIINDIVGDGYMLVSRRKHGL